MATGGPIAAICVQIVNDQSVVQFTLIHTFCCVLHRRVSRVIHRLKWYSLYTDAFYGDPYSILDQSITRDLYLMLFNINVKIN